MLSAGFVSAATVATDDFSGSNQSNGGTGWASDWSASNTYQSTVGKIDGDTMGGFASGSVSRSISPSQTTAGDTAEWSISLRSDYDVVSDDFNGGLVRQLGMNVLDDAGGVLLTMKFVEGSSDLLLNDGGSDFGVSGLSFLANEIYDFSFSSVIGSNQYSFEVTGRGATGTASGMDFTYNGRTTGGVGGFQVFWTGPGGSGNDIFIDNAQVDVTAIPEPTSALLALVGGLVLMRRKRC
ncbi:MAG: hypothetical protein AAGC74_10005 [Verrucomicrobiota bacterium]